MLEVKGAFDDPNGSHIVIECVAEAFEGKRSLARQQVAPSSPTALARLFSLTPLPTPCGSPRA